MDWASHLAALLSGVLVGGSLSLIGGGGSILAVPLMIYAVGVTDAHVAIGTSALAVAVNAFANLFLHWRAGTVKWPCALVFGLAGIIGASFGSSLGKNFDGDLLLFLFSFIMIAIAATMLARHEAAGDADVHLNPRMIPRLVAVGLGAGAISGFFGIGGGFLIVPGIMLGSGMTILNAVGSSLFSVGAFGTTTAVNYAMSGLIDWRVALEFIAGGAVGGIAGMHAAIRLAGRKRTLTYVFAGLVSAVALYMAVRSGLALAA
jgi:uncharacterized membrane protein YfcA